MTRLIKTARGKLELLFAKVRTASDAQHHRAIIALSEIAEELDDLAGDPDPGCELAQPGAWSDDSREYP